MDVPIKPKHPLAKYKYYIICGVIILALVVYGILSALGPRKLRYDKDRIEIAEVKEDKFLEYLDIEGIVKPILTVKLNVKENGSVERIIAEEGSMLTKGDSILVLQNTELTRSIQDEQYELEKQQISYEQKLLEMKRKSSALKRQTIETIYKLQRLNKQYALDEEEFEIGIKSKAQLEIASDEYNFNKQNTAFLLEELRHDSLMNIIQDDLLKNELKRSEYHFAKTKERLSDLVVRAPISGQLGSINAILGQLVSSGSSIGELKVTDDFKLGTKISEYYIDRIVAGLPASVNYQNKKYPLKISKVIPEIKERQFEIELVFTGEKPDNIRIGKNYRIQIELGQPENSIVVPRGNFFQTTGGRWIFKLNDTKTKATRVPIVVGRQNPVQYEITEGLKAGDNIIITGYDNFGDAEEIILQ